MRNAYKVFDGKPEGKRQLRRYVCTWEDTVLHLLSKMLGSERVLDFGIPILYTFTMHNTNS
jgi:hypothetical protein